MKIQHILTGFMTLALLVLPAVSMANTYNFIDTSGNMQSVQAPNSTVALDTAFRLGIHSGVILVK